MEWRVRPLLPADAGAVADVARRSRRTAMPWLPDLHSADEDVRFYAAELASSSGWAVEVAEAVVGFALSRDGWLNHLYVLPEWQGQGAGTALLGAALAGSPEPLDLWVFTRNEVARDFYRARGFTEVERTDGSANEEGEADVRLRSPGARSRVVIREARIEDVEGIARAHVASWQSGYRGLLPSDLLDGLDWRDRAERWRSLLAGPGDVRVLVAEADDRIAGFCAVGPPRDEDLADSDETWFELYSIYLTQAYWGTGLGSRLWSRARAGLPTGVQAVSLWVLEGNARARAFYGRAGFHPDGRREMTTRVGRKVPEIRLVWRKPPTDS